MQFYGRRWHNFGCIFPNLPPKTKTKKKTVGTQVAWVSKDRRVVIDLNLAESALALNLAPGNTTQLWAFVGAKKQIQILPPESELAKLRESYQRIRKEQLPWDKSDDDKMEVHRRLQGFFRITCRARTQSKSLRLTLPREAIDVDLLRTNEALVFVVIGAVVELWRRDRWTEMAAIQSPREFTEQVQDILENDE